MSSKDYHPIESEAKRLGALYCEVDAEPLERYRKGGYHPTRLGDIFKDGRYQVIHKTGLGRLRNCLACKKLYVSIYTDAIYIRELSTEL